MKLNSFKITVSILIIVIVLLPSIILSQYIFISLKSNLKDEIYIKMERIRDEKINQIKGFYSQEFHDFEKIISYISFDDDERLNKEIKFLLDFQPNIKQVVLYNYNFKPLVNVTRAGFMDSDSVSDKIRVTLQKNFYFSSYFLNNIVEDNNQSDLVFFYKDIKSDNYLSITLEYSYLDIFLKEFGEVSIDIYNNHKQIIASSRKDYDSRKVVNNPLIQKMDLGLSENIFYNDFYNSYGFIDIGEEKLFINVSVPEKYLEARIDNISNNITIIYIIYLFLSIIFGAFFVRFFYTIKESEIRTEIFSNRFSFFFRLKNTLTYMDSKFVEMQKLSNAINYLKNDISLILQDIPNKDIGSENDEKETDPDQ